VPTLAPVVAGEGAAVDLLPQDWEVLAMIDGVRNLHEISKRLNRSEFEVAKTVFGLESTGIVAILDPRTSGSFHAPDTHFEELVEQAQAALTRGDLDEAQQAVAAARAKRSEVPIVAVLAGQLHLARAEHEEADSAFRRALGLDPAMGQAHRLLGDSAAMRGRFAEAVEWWQRWMRLEHDANGDTGSVPEDVGSALAAANTLAEFLKKTHG
jgi:tetratricopeptide (TPR) repeat protein